MPSVPGSPTAEQPPSPDAQSQRAARRRDLLAAVIADDDREARGNPAYRPWEWEACGE